MTPGRYTADRSAVVARVEDLPEPVVGRPSPARPSGCRLPHVASRGPSSVADAMQRDETTQRN
jgi:hypothetical protein